MPAKSTPRSKPQTTRPARNASKAAAKAAPKAAKAAKSPRKPMTYAAAGVSIDAGNAFVSNIFKRIPSTFSQRVQRIDGGFAAMFNLVNDKDRFNDQGWRRPVLVSCNDGVGTKLKVAQMMKQHNTIGRDCVAMCVNDLICLGARPLFFLDYLGVGKLQQGMAEAILKGLVEGCLDAQCALIGGETSEMPDVYAKDDYDLVGFSVGVVEEDQIITGATIEVGDVVIGLPSSGLHSNGYTLARKAVFEAAGYKHSKKLKELGGQSVGQAMLEPTRIYVRAVTGLVDAFQGKNVVRGLANITGGGLLENIPRILPPKVGVALDPALWPCPAVFGVVQRAGNIDMREMYRVFNMGIGFVVIVAKGSESEVLKCLADLGEDGACVIGSVVKGKGEVRLAGLS